MQERDIFIYGIHGLGLLGLVTFLFAIGHNYAGLEYMNSDFGMVDIFIALMGITLMTPSAILIIQSQPLFIVVGFIGGVLLIGSVMHDILGLHFGFNVILGKLDFFVSLLGIILLVPCLYLLFNDNHEKSVYLGLVGMLLFFGALFHDAVGFTLSRQRGIGPLDKIISCLGIALMALFFLIKLRLSEGQAKYSFIGGIVIFIGAIGHDLTGFHFGPSTWIGILDSFFALLGITFTAPYLQFLSAKESRRFHLKK